jgi:hypothetical protein
MDRAGCLKACAPALDKFSIALDPGLERPGLKPFGKGRWKRLFTRREVAWPVEK